jgi:hypothetical protein
VARANDLVAFDRATGELAGIMSADVLNGIILAFEIEYHGLRSIHINNSPLAWRKFTDSRNRHPITHSNSIFNCS